MTDLDKQKLPPQKDQKKVPGTPIQKQYQFNLFWLLLLFWMLVFFYNPQNSKSATEISYSQFHDHVETKNIESVVIKGSLLLGRYKDSEAPPAGFDFKTTLPNFEDSSVIVFLRNNNVDISVKPDTPPIWAEILTKLLPWLLVIALFFYASKALRGRMGPGAGMFSFGKSRAKRFEANLDGPNYNDVAGLDSAKRDLQEIVDYLKAPEKFQELGAKMPRGILLMGAPGTGKTLLARATATEANVPFYSVSGSEFIEMYVGVGASRVRDMFENARKEAPALIFIDEIDSVGRVRGTGMGGGNDEREQTLNQILAEMDGFAEGESVVVLAATNRPDVLDPALLRPGRFDRKVVLDLPQRKARVKILEVHTRKTPLDNGLDLDEIAAATIGFSGADLANLVNEAALLAARKDEHALTQEDFRQARDKIILGSESEELLSPLERQRVACHEAGHAITALFSKHSDPVLKVSIIPRGRSLGVTEQRPLEDRHNVDEIFLQEQIGILLGGRCAEKLIYHNASTGAADDLKKATKIARKMVAKWGMSEKLGPVGFQVEEEHPFLGRELTEPKDFSEHTAEMLDEEVIQLLHKIEKCTLALLTKHRASLDALSKALLEKETLDEEDIQACIKNTAHSAPQT